MKQKQEFEKAVERLNQLKADRETSPAELAGQLSAQREVVRICSIRLAEAEHNAAMDQVTALNTKAQEIRNRSAELNREADHFAKTAEGTLRGLYGEDGVNCLAGRNVRPLKFQELAVEAVNILGQADALEASARSISASNAGGIAAAVSQLLTAAQVEN